MGQRERRLTYCSISGRGIESRHSRSSSSTLLGDSALRSELKRQVSVQVHLLKDFVFTNERGNHLADLTGFEQLACLSVKTTHGRGAGYHDLPRPTPGIPALLDTTVKSLMSGRSRTALMRVLGTPEKPKPPTKTVEERFMSLMASAADGHILLIARCEAVIEKFRRHSGRNTEG